MGKFIKHDTIETPDIKVSGGYADTPSRPQGADEKMVQTLEEKRLALQEKKRKLELEKKNIEFQILSTTQELEEATQDLTDHIQSN